MAATKAPSTKAPKPPAKAKTATPKPKTKPKAKIGRPSKYTQALADTICERLASGISMRTVCLDPAIPEARTLFTWMRVYPEFLQQYTRAKAESADAIFDEMMDIADDGTNDWMEQHDKEGACVGYKVNGEHVQRSRLRIDTRKWALSKLAPKKYGDNLAVNHGVQEGSPLEQMMQMAVGRTLKPVE
jgi:hypothetical protein